ncbi:hypothetical protein TNCT_496661 [Trichonephila clavata]|uniref:Uncharacterized protein n=1 Tax=Trichonephila clavata TaxID=2740835 RepID=A0A8X6FEK8_TRICU|nr:hypothetical protein TNCT_496661 [Trichonephila clavata]
MTNGVNTSSVTLIDYEKDVVWSLDSRFLGLSADSHSRKLLNNSMLAPCIHCQQQYTRARPNDTDTADGQNVDFECHVANKAGSEEWNKEAFMLGKTSEIYLSELAIAVAVSFLELCHRCSLTILSSGLAQLAFRSAWFQHSLLCMTLHYRSMHCSVDALH